MTRHRALVGVLVLVGSLAWARSALAQFSSDERACREAISKTGQKLADTVAKTLNSCHKQRSAQKIGAGIDCNDIASADTKGKVDAVAEKLVDQTLAKCSALTPSDLGYDECPTPCADTIATFQDVADCEVCLLENSGEAMVLGSQGLPDPLELSTAEATCHATIGKNQTKHFKTIVKERRKCQKAEEAGGATNTSTCSQSDPSGKIASVRTKGEDAVALKCAVAGVNLDDLDSCSDLTLNNLLSCVFGGSAARGEATFQWLYGLTAASVTTTTTPPSTTTSTTTTTTPGGQDPQCPASGEIVLYAGVRETPCASNVDCEVDGAQVGVCDTGLGQCVTDTDLDTGWTGIAHNSDINDFVLTRGSLECPGPFNGSSPEPCGQCQVLGLSPETDLCRCSNDNHTICDDTFSLDSDDCGIGLGCSTNADCKVCSVTTSTSCNLDVDCPSGEYCLNGLRQPICSAGQCIGTCNCYFGPPLPLSSGSTPACAVNRFAVDISGTANVDLGQGEITANLKTAVYLGELVTVPCPYCDGDTTPRDGIRDGTCVLGDNAGQACDVQATNMTFPAPAGNGHSLDCLPASGKNVSGTGLTINLVQSTGAQSLTAGVLCGFPPFAPETCPCGICSMDTSVGCRSNVDCTGVGVCQRAALGKPRADGCADSPVIGVCEVVSRACTGDGETSCASNVDCALPGGTCVGVEGQCPAANGPTDTYCDGVFRSNGEPYVTCNNNADCDATDCGGGVGVGLCGTCSLTSLRKCFLDPLYVFGKADPSAPVGAAAFCIPPTANTGINDVAGLPGPARVKNATRAKTFCSSNPAVEYTPGVGGCPP